MDLILAIDCGTTSTRALLFAADGTILAVHQRDIAQHYPRPGWVEHDAAEIRDRTLQAATAALAEVGAGRVRAIGLTNQRETICFWNRRTGEPLAPAIVWQDRRTADDVAALRAAGHEARITAITGLLLDPYFSASKIGWALRHWPQVKAAAERGDLAIGTVDSWLCWCLSGGRAHLSDVSNAARTSLMGLAEARWSAELIDLFGVPPASLPAICPTAGWLADAQIGGRTIPITGMAGDQQAATIGQGCLRAGDAKCTYGTGIFLLANAGDVPPVSRNRLLATRLTEHWFALEGSVFVGGNAVKWLRDGLGLLETAAQSEELAQSVPDSGGVTFVPAFAGLGAPHWQPDARGLLTGLTAGTSRAHIVRATLEAMGQQTADLLDAFAADGVAPAVLKVDGGMTANNWLCQDLADATGLPVERPRAIETTALGAAMLAAVGSGLHPTLPAAAAAMVHADRSFTPQAPADLRLERRAQWQRAIRQTLAGSETAGDGDDRA